MVINLFGKGLGEYVICIFAVSYSTPLWLVTLDQRTGSCGQSGQEVIIIYYGLSTQLYVGAGDLNSCPQLVQQATCLPSLSGLPSLLLCWRLTYCFSLFSTYSMGSSLFCLLAETS